MLRLGLAIVLASAASMAQALSCMPHDVSVAYRWADASDAAYGVVRGVLEFDETLLPVTDWDNQEATPAQTDIPARLVGQSMSHDGTGTPFAKDVTLRVYCAGPWCSGANSGSEVLAFVRYDPEAMIVETAPCGAFLFDTPSKALLQRVENCLRRGRCRK
jgi:hypothetical protein